MCYVIITCRSLLWTLLSISTAMLIIAAAVSPHWLIGQERRIGLGSTHINVTDLNSEMEHRPTIGIFNRCTRVHKFGSVYERESCATFVAGYNEPDSEFPHAWKAALFFFTIAAIALVFAMMLSVMSLCVRSFFGKSIFTISGLVQSIAGLFCVLGMVLYPAGWGSDRLKRLCGEYAGPYVIDNCTLGWSFYLGIVGTVLVFVTAMLSIQAEHSTSCRKVEEEMLEGKNLICVV